MNEIWKDIPEYHGKYQVSNMGRVRSIKKTGKIRILQGGYCVYGYRHVSINGKTTKVHRIVALAFIGKSNLQVNHKDGNKKNNRLENLEYCTAKQNTEHAFSIGKIPHSENHHSSILKNKDVIYIRKNVHKRGDISKIAKSLGVTRQCVSMAYHNVSWKRMEVTI